MACSEAEDADGLAPAKDDNEAARFFIRRTLPILDCVDYKYRSKRLSKAYRHDRGTAKACGVRFIPMTDDVYHSLKNILASRKKVKAETIVDEYSGLIMLDEDSNP